MPWMSYDITSNVMIHKLIICTTQLKYNTAASRHTNRMEGGGKKKETGFEDKVWGGRERGRREE